MDLTSPLRRITLLGALALSGLSLSACGAASANHTPTKADATARAVATKLALAWYDDHTHSAFSPSDLGGVTLPALGPLIFAPLQDGGVVTDVRLIGGYRVKSVTYSINGQSICVGPSQPLKKGYSPAKVMKDC